MIIKKITIDGFGAIRQREYVFNDGLNIIAGDNESGKTTVAEFIRAMLYGFDSRARDVRENSRKRYLPADGGVMGGRMEVEKDGNIYIIDRRFGKTAAGDKLTVTDGVTGKELDVDPSQLTGLDGESFSKTLYIKQMCTKVEDSKDDQIRQRLINLCQTGEEDLSYQAAMKSLDTAHKQLASRVKGVIPALNQRLSQLHIERGEVASSQSRRESLERRLAQAKDMRNSKVNTATQENREGEYYQEYEKWRKAREEEEAQSRSEHEKIYAGVEKELRASVRWATINAVIAILCIAWLVYHISKGYSIYAPLLVGAAFGAICIKNLSEQKQMRKFLLENKQYTCKKYENDVKYKDWFKSQLGSDKFEDIPILIKQYGDSLRAMDKTRSNEAIEAAENVKDIESEIASINTRPTVAVDQDITMCENQIRAYEQKAAHICKAMDAMESAFRKTEQNFAPLITREASPVLEEITGGEYTGLLSDNVYTLSAVKQDGSIVSADYLSTGCYDQIYFALRIGIIKLMAPDMPVIFDDAFAYYDNKRLANTMAAIKKLPNQILLFSCHERELGTRESSPVCHNLNKE